MVIRGEWTNESARKIIDQIRIESERRRFEKVLVDLTELSSPEKELTRFISGELIAKILGFSRKVAAFANPKQINRFAETLAVNRGASFKIFENKFAEILWLNSNSSDNKSIIIRA